MDTAANERYRFGPYTLDPAAQVLLHHDKPVEIQPKPFEIQWTAWLQVDPALDSLRSDARWPELVRKCGF